MIFGYVSETGYKDAAYRLLAYAFQDIYGGRLPRLEKTAYGKPYFPDCPKIFFSLSHTKTCVMAAIGDTPCGCDIETVRPVKERLPERLCTVGELEQFTFFQLWVLKESYIKLLGGQTEEFRNMRFSLDNNVILTPEKDVYAALYNLQGCSAAVLCRGEKAPEQLTQVLPEKLS